MAKAIELLMAVAKTPARYEANEKKMNVLDHGKDAKRLTTTEEVFRLLRSDIISIKLQPGAKISEVEVAKSCGVSRQPVREAFMRLGDLNLLEIRPQRATRVRKISHQDLRNTRFIREAVEVEVVRVAAMGATPERLDALEANLALQASALAQQDAAGLKKLDYEFHRLICVAADRLPAFKIIAENKSHTERACMLELADTVGMQEVFDGHSEILNAIRKGDVQTAVAKTRTHLAHLDATLENASKNNPEYFED